MNTKSKGDATEAKILAALVAKGKQVLVPWGDNARYDLVVDSGNRFERIQCKTGRMSDGAVKFSVCSSYAHRGGSNRDYHGEVEFFGVYCPDNDKTYLVPVHEVGTRLCSLRVTTPKNGQAHGVLWAELFEI